MKTVFDYEECMLIAMYRQGSRRETAAEIHGILPDIAGDGEMLALAVGTLEKLEAATDEEFAGIDMEKYGLEPLEGA